MNESILTIMVIETFLASLCSIAATYMTFAAYHYIKPIQKVVIPGRDEAHAIDQHLSTIEPAKWTGREQNMFHDLSVRDAARIITAGIIFYAYMSAISPLM